MCSSTVYDVEEIVLHLPDDPAKGGHHVAENAVEVHPAQLVRDAPRFPEHLHEAGPVRRVAAEAGVDAMAVSPQPAQRPRRHAFQLRLALHRQERVEHRRGPTLEQRLVADVQELVDREKLVVDGDWLGRYREEPGVPGSAKGSR